MTTIQNKKINSTKIIETDYKALITTIINHPIQAGFTIQEIKARIAIEKAMEGKNIVSFKLDPAAHLKLVEIVTNFNWGCVDQAIVDFVDYIQSIK